MTDATIEVIEMEPNQSGTFEAKRFVREAIKKPKQKDYSSSFSDKNAPRTVYLHQTQNPITAMFEQKAEEFFNTLFNSGLDILFGRKQNVR